MTGVNDEMSGGIDGADVLVKAIVMEWIVLCVEVVSVAGGDGVYVAVIVIVLGVAGGDVCVG